MHLLKSGVACIAHVCLSLQILSALPHTVRGVGLAFGAHEPRLRHQEHQDQRNRRRLGDQLGFLVVVSLFECVHVPTGKGTEDRSAVIH